MNLNHAYVVPPSADQGALLLAAIDAAVALSDAVAPYGFSANEELVGRGLKPHRGASLTPAQCAD